MTRTLRLCTVLMAALLLFAGCSRPPAAETGGAKGKIPANIVSEAGGKAAFIEFYSPS